jgi:hypothetical protein
MSSPHAGHAQQIGHEAALLRRMFGPLIYATKEIKINE